MSGRIPGGRSRSHQPTSLPQADSGTEIVPLDWEPHTYLTLPWRQHTVRGTRADRDAREITVALPPYIAELNLTMDRPLAAMTSATAGDLRNLDLVHGRTLAGLNELQVRTEAVDSSRIENVEASLADYGRALLGVGANSSAIVMASATRAMSRMIEDVGRTRTITMDTLLTAHRDLFARNPEEHHRAGLLRTTQNWIGGSNYSPVGALHVPPPPDTVASYLADLVEFANRDDLPILVQAAIAHAQFETIHPFIDGNGRIGRALIHAILRRRRATHHLVVPIASALVAHRERYFGALGDYRAGQAHTIVAMLSSATSIATSEARRAADDLVAMRAKWHAQSPARPGSPLFRLMDLATEEPILTLDLIADRLGLTTDEASTATREAVAAGVLKRAPRSRRSPVWLAGDVLTLLDSLRVRIQETSHRLQSRA